MNFKTFLILFILMFLQSCAISYEKTFSEDNEEKEDRSYETGTFNK